MARRTENLRRLAGLHHLAGIHHDDVVRGFGHQRQIVGDQQQRHVFALLQVQQQFDDLRLDGHVERGRRLIGDQQLRPTGDGHGDHHALAHAAGKLVRVHVQPRGRIGNAHLGQQVDSALAASAAVAALMHLQRLHDLVTDGIARVQAGHRILEDHRYFRTHQLAALFFGDLAQILAVELQLVGHHLAGEIDQAHDRQRADGFAGAGFTDDADHLALLHAVTDAVYRAKRGAFVTEVHRKLVYIQ